MNDFKSVVKKLSSVFFCKLSRSHPAAYREMPLYWFSEIDSIFILENNILIDYTPKFLPTCQGYKFKGQALTLTF